MNPTCINCGKEIRAEMKCHDVVFLEDGEEMNFTACCCPSDCKCRPKRPASKADEQTAMEVVNKIVGEPCFFAEELIISALTKAREDERARCVEKIWEVFDCGCGEADTVCNYCSHAQRAIKAITD